MSTTITVRVQPDHLERQATAKSPGAALAELVWNSLDADATRVDVLIRRALLGTIDEIAVLDNGNGIPDAAVAAAFGSLGGSSKRQRGGRSGDGRLLHGHLGKGRFKAFFLGADVVWQTVFENATGRWRYEIRGARERLGTFTVSDPEAAPDAPLGTRVVITNVASSFPSLDPEPARRYLAGEFALYLRQYPSVRIHYGGVALDPAAVERSVEVIPLGPLTLDSGQEVTASLTVIEWLVEAERALYLCDGHGVTLSRVQAGIHAPGFRFTAYLHSDLIRQAEIDGTLDLEELNPDLQCIVTAGRDELRQYFREREAAKAADLVAGWKREAVYPYEGEPQDPVRAAERQVFDVLALNVHAYLPAFEDADTKSRRLTFHLLRQALETDSTSLHRILRDVLGLPEDRREELARILERTSLTAMIAAAKVVADRLEVVRGLEELIFDDDLKAIVRERTQLHRLVAENTWLFGEAFNLSVDDQSLTEVLKKHCAAVGREILDATEVRTAEGSRGIVDLMLSRSIPQSDAARQEHLIVELKAPSVKVGQEEVAQLKKYAYAIINDERFDTTRTRWSFWVVSNAMERVVAAEARQADRPPGWLTELDGRARIFVRTWAEIFHDSKARLRFFSDHLAYAATRESAFDHLRRTYAKYLPGALMDVGGPGAGPAASPETTADATPPVAATEPADSRAGPRRGRRSRAKRA